MTKEMLSADGVPMPVELMGEIADVLSGHDNRAAIMALTTVLAAVLEHSPPEYRQMVLLNLLGKPVELKQ
jgi:hypothetical protein